MNKVTNTEKHDLYLNAFVNATMDPENQDTKKLILYGVKMVNTKPKQRTITREEAERNFQLTNTIKALMGTLTPLEFVNLFPIDKDFDGHKYEAKDYFYTRDYIRTLPDKPIGNIEAVMNFLWEYHNIETLVFSATTFGYVSDLRKLDGRPGIMEEWASMNGIKTYTMHTDQKGKRFMIDKETGKASRVKRKMPRYLRIVK